MYSCLPGTLREQRKVIERCITEDTGPSAAIESKPVHGSTRGKAFLVISVQGELELKHSLD